MALSFLERVVGFCVRRPWTVLILSLILTLLAGYATVTRFAINTDTARLISSEVAWRRNETLLEKAFPQRADLIVAVIDGTTPEIADEAAERLASALPTDGGVIRSVRRPDAGPFFDRNGLLFLSVDEVTRTTEQLVQQQGFLGPLAADPSLRGVLGAITLGLRGVQAGEARLDDLAGPANALAGTIEQVNEGKPARLSWQRLLSGEEAAKDPKVERRFVLIQPVLDYGALQPAARATELVRRTVSELGLTRDQGVRVRLTGPAPLADEEFGTLAENAELNHAVTLVLIGLILFAALRSGRVILAVLVTLFIGLIVTAGLGLVVVGQFNLISVAFFALFVGLGVDFGIQFAVRYRAERYERPDDLPGSVVAASRGVGWPLTLAAVSLLAGFFSFLPTEFRGVSELGLIAGMGMIIAYVATLTVLPALIVLLKPPGEKAEVGMSALAVVDHWILNHRTLVNVATALVVLAGMPFLLKLPFDSNPMNLRSQQVESVATFLDLTRNPDTAPNTADVLAPSLAEAEPLAQRLAALPEVARVVWLKTFIPEDQEEKLAIIQDAAGLLSAVLTPVQVKRPPTDAETLAAIKAASTALTQAASRAEGAQAAPARRLAAALDALAASSPERRETAERAVTVDLKRLLERLRLLMSAAPITQENLPPEIVSGWVSSDGRARLEVFPKGNANDNEVLNRFSAAVRTVAPDATGAPIVITESGHTVTRAFLEAGLFALLAISAILYVALRNLRDVVLTLGPLVLAAIMTLQAAYLLGMPLNFANIIALPLIFAVGVAFHIYYIIAWREGVADMLASSLTRAIFFSAITTGVAFGSLCVSSHPGTASMGKLLALSLFFTLLAAFIIVPAFLGPPREAKHADDLGAEPVPAGQKSE